jgi:hypothetical protein
MKLRRRKPVPLHDVAGRKDMVLMEIAKPEILAEPLNWPKENFKRTCQASNSLWRK